MGRTLQNRKRRSSRPTIRQSNRPKRPVRPLGNDVVAKNWNKKETLTQNYRRLGLLATLRAPTGGVERRLHDPATPTPHAFAIIPAEKSLVSETRVERGPAGQITRVVRVGRTGRPNPLGDLLNELESDSEPELGGAGGRQGQEDAGDEWGGIDDDNAADRGGDDNARPAVVRALEREARRKPAPREEKPSAEAEVQWLRRLVEKHGNSVAAMFRDRRLNPMQQTEGDIARRLRRLYGPGWTPVLS